MTDHGRRGKRALITGGSSGLGVDFARELAGRGCDLVLVARRVDLLQSVRDELIGAYGVEVDAIAMDLTEDNAPQVLYERLVAEEKPVDILVNNAGYGLYGMFSEVPWEKYHDMLELDVVVLTHLTRLFLPGMLERRFGRILLLSSIGAYAPSPTYAAYAAAKTYVLYFGEALRFELRGTGVTCTVLAPGITETAFTRVAGQRRSLYQRIAMMQSRDVARTGIESMLRGKASVVPGRINSLTAWANRLVPRQISARIAYLMMIVGQR
jgi:short-subunit dehydrogenase